MTNKVANEVTLNTLEAQGKALAVEWKSIERGLKASFTKHTKADGFDTRLGKLMVALKAEGGERISPRLDLSSRRLRHSQRLKHSKLRSNSQHHSLPNKSSTCWIPTM